MKVKVLRYTSNRNFEQPSIKSECLPACALDRRSSREQHHLPSSRHSKARPCAAYGNRPGNHPSPQLCLCGRSQQLGINHSGAKLHGWQHRQPFRRRRYRKTRQMPRQMQARARHRAPAAPQGTQQPAVQRQTRANRQTPVAQIKHRANPRTLPSPQTRHPAPRQIPFQRH